MDNDTCPCCAARAQAQTAARVANARAADLERDAVRMRAEIDVLKALTTEHIARWERLADDYTRVVTQRMRLDDQVEALERQIAEAQSARAEETR